MLGSTGRFFSRSIIRGSKVIDLSFWRPNEKIFTNVTSQNLVVILRNLNMDKMTE